MAFKKYDVAIIGQGLAGTALAWWLHWAGKSFVIVDRNEATTSSKIAAGLLTPVTGRKLVPTWRLNELWPVAIEFYRRVEATVATEVFTELPAVRLFVDQAEVEAFRKRDQQFPFGELVTYREELHREFIHAPCGGLQMQPAGKLGTRQYLNRSRTYFLERDLLRDYDLDLATDLVIESTGVSCQPLHWQADQVVFCQGIAATANPWFRDVVFKPAKGEILTCHINGWDTQEVFHQGAWLAPCGNGLFQAGSTYEWKVLDQVITEQGREEVLCKLRRFLKAEVEVVEQHAAVRPVHVNQYPVLGRHPRLPQLVYFNGLGSKGSLQAPALARQLLGVLDGRVEPDADVDLVRKTRWTC